jgi:hypothetical protein
MAKNDKNPDPVFVIDTAAVLKAGDVAGQYLDEIGKTDLATLSAQEWQDFLFKVVGYSFIYAAKPPQNSTAPF